MGRQQDVATRIRLRIRARLDELGMTARELARAVREDATRDGEVDAWISGVLKGTTGLHWKYFDAVCDKLRLSPAELVRHDDDTLRELTPTEMRLLRHYQEWPDSVQRRWLDVMEFFSTTRPDDETSRVLERLRLAPVQLRRPILSWLTHLLGAGIPPAIALDGDVPVVDAVAALRRKKPSAGQIRKSSASRTHADDRQGRP